MRRILGSGHAQTLIFLERVAISIIFLTKGYVAVEGELREEKRAGLKPLFPMLAIAYFHKV
jgi:hypothetical protein